MLFRRNVLDLKMLFYLPPTNTWYSRGTNFLRQTPAAMPIGAKMRGENKNDIV